MDDLGYTAPPPRRTARTIAMGLGMIGVGAAAGAVIATAVSADATTGSGPTAATASAPAGYGSANGTRGPGDGRHGGGPGGGGAEKPVPAATAATLRAAALKAVPGGTVDRVETDSGDATYEVHMTKSDGTKVTVKFAKDLSVKGVEAGMGK